MAIAKKNFEIELRSRFDEAKYKKLKKYLNSNAKDLGEDDKDVYFFLLPDKLLKAVHNISQKSAKIVLKLNKIGKGSHFEEIEIPIQQAYFEEFAHMFTALELGDSMHSFQKRHNYLYKGVELALKWSEIWGHHLELEVVIDDLKRKTQVEDKIYAVAKHLGVSIMTDKELIIFTQKAESDYKKKKNRRAH